VTAHRVVTLNLTDAVYRVAEQVAAATRQPLDHVLQASIAQALPPLEDVPAGYTPPTQSARSEHRWLGAFSAS
jgi:hypothetical protein